MQVYKLEQRRQTAKVTGRLFYVNLSVSVSWNVSFHVASNPYAEFYQIVADDSYDEHKSSHGQALMHKK